MALLLGGLIAGWPGFLGGATAGGRGEASPPEAGVATAVDVLDLEGRPVRPLAFGTGAGTGTGTAVAGASTETVCVLIFVSNDCPIANRYAPEIRRIAARYAKLGVRFWMVHPLADETAASVREHAKAYDLPGTVVRDPRRELARALGITVTPEAAVVDRKGALRYRGRIDDRFPALGQKRSQATRHDLCEALDAVLAGKPVPVSRTPAVGCVLAGGV